MEEYTKEEEQQEEESESIDLKRWFQDNLRVIISVLIVVAIAIGILSYSNRTDSPSITDESVSTEQTDIPSSVDIAKGNDQSKNAAQKNETASQKQVVTTPTPGESKETDTAFVETAGKGEGKTHLARRALANYLEKNPDSTLTKEHKIYIEDYLRKHVAGKGVAIGSSTEFSKDLIAGAIELSKKLSDKQLNNLKKYSARVSSPL